MYKSYIGKVIAEPDGGRLIDSQIFMGWVDHLMA